jgi:hypothetical protein
MRRGGTSWGSAMRYVEMVERRKVRDSGVDGRSTTDEGRTRGRVRSLRTPVTWVC